MFILTGSLAAASRIVYHMPPVYVYTTGLAVALYTTGARCSSIRYVGSAGGSGAGRTAGRTAEGAAEGAAVRLHGEEQLTVQEQLPVWRRAAAGRGMLPTTSCCTNR